MSARIVSMETLKEERRKALVGQTIERKIPFFVAGELFGEATLRIVNGEMETYEITSPIGEMLTNNMTRKELLEKVVLDVELGKTEIPLLYKPVYETLEDSNFPEVFDAAWAIYGSIIFLEHLEGGEVRFGSMQVEQGPIARITSYAAGFEYTERMVKFNQTFNMELLNRSFGEAYNALLNHIHFAPILTYTYADANKTAATGEATDSLAIKTKKTLQSALQTCALSKRPGNVLLAATADKYTIEESLKEQTVAGTNYPGIGEISTIIFYDGWETKVARKTYTYAGVSAGKCYLIRPKKGFKELIKEDLLIDTERADLSRLVEAQVVGRCYRGVFASLPENVQEITLPT